MITAVIIITIIASVHLRLSLSSLVKSGLSSSSGLLRHTVVRTTKPFSKNKEIRCSLYSNPPLLHCLSVASSYLAELSELFVKIEVERCLSIARLTFIRLPIRCCYP